MGASESIFGPHISNIIIDSSCAPSYLHGMYSSALVYAVAVFHCQDVRNLVFLAYLPDIDGAATVSHSQAG